VSTNYKKPKIKVLGLGGGGCNFQEHMISVIGGDLDPESFVAINTDQQSLQASKAKVKLQIGPNGLGAGADPNVGREAAEYSEDEIKEICKGVDLIIIFTGFGGGTGSGAAPVVARIAREQGALVFGIVTKPFDFEGRVRKRIAEEAIIEFKKNADVTVVVSNQLLFKITNQYTTFREAFKIIDNMCASFVGSILDIFRTNGLINVDFADIDSTIRDKGVGLIGVGYSDGEDAAIEAVMKALANPLLENVTMRSASNALVHIAGNDISLVEVEEIMKKIHNELGDDVNIIHGMTIGEQGCFNRESFLYPMVNSLQNPLSSGSNSDINHNQKWVRVMVIVTGISEEEKSDAFDDGVDKSFGNNFDSSSINNHTESSSKDGHGNNTNNNIFNLLQKLSKK
jgi:cell division protein FtsZ